MFATNILNLPEVASLSFHQMKKKPEVRNGQIVMREMMPISLSCDRRVIDGHAAAAFMYELIRYLENPALWSLEMT